MTDTSSRTDHPVLVAGGGPAGLATAAELAHHGIRSVLVEPRTEVSHTRPRAKTTSPRTMELFRRWGIADLVRDRAALSPRWCRKVVFCDTLAGEVITEFDDAFGMRAAPVDDFAESGQQVPQPVVEQVLREHLAATGLVDLRFGDRLVGLVEHVNHVTCEIARADTSTYQLDVEFVAGCDGARGASRAAVGATFEGVTSPRSNLNLVFRAPGLDPSVGDAVQYWAIGPEVKGTVGPLDRDGLWWAGLGGIDASCSPDRAIALLCGLLGQEADDVGIELLATDPWTPRMLMSSTYATDRVFLVGESAHVNPPFGGHGFNTCVGDAVNLGWKIAAVLAGWGAQTLLASYEAERRHVAQETIDSAQRNLEASGPDIAQTAEGLQHTKFEEFNSLGLVLGYSYAGSPVIWSDAGALPPDVTMFTPSCEPGSRLPHAWIAPEVSLYDTLGRGFTLLHPAALVDDPGLARDLRDLVASSPVPLASAPLPLDWNHHPYVLVRPDQHVCWVGTELGRLGRDVLDVIRGAHPR